MCGFRVVRERSALSNDSEAGRNPVGYDTYAAVVVDQTQQHEG